MKRGDSEISHNRSSKKTKADPSDQNPPTEERNDSNRPQMSASIAPSGPSQDTSRPTRRLAGFAPSMDAAAEKLAPPSPMSLALLHLPFPQATLPCHRPASRLSREEFRQRLIWTIDEALRIVDDDREYETTTNIRNVRRED
uniref:Uncharacterized protein n=1 Tax=Amphora coffeiformis TaxID=265554 RepID=A0A7S3LC25_9STRA